MKKITLLMMLLAINLLMCACSSKYMLSGTWYSDENDGRTFVFYDNGNVKINDEDFHYEMEGEETILIQHDQTLIRATIDRDTEVIQCPQSDGLPICLYKNIADAKTAAEGKADTLKSSMEDRLKGRWTIKGRGNNTIAEFDADRLTMITEDAGKKHQTIYRIKFITKNKVQFIAGNEIVTEFDLEIGEETLIFKNNNEVIEYIKENTK